MPPFGPIKRRDLIRALTKAGFLGPVPGSKHDFMVRGDQQVRLPNSHRGDISVNLLLRVLRQAGITREEWERL